MIFEVADVVRAHVLSASAVEVARSYVAPSPRWAREACAQLVVHYATTRSATLGQGPQPAQFGSGLAGHQAMVPVHDLVLTYVAPCYPMGGDEGEAPEDDALQDWSRRFLADCDRINQALLDNQALAPKLRAVGVISELTPGPTIPQHGGLVASVAWPFSINAI